MQQMLVSFLINESIINDHNNLRLFFSFSLLCIYVYMSFLFMYHQNSVRYVKNVKKAFKDWKVEYGIIKYLLYFARVLF